MPRWAYMIPPAHRVSPTHWSIPYLRGMSMSVAKASRPPIRVTTKTYFAPRSIARRLVSAMIVAGSLLAAMSRRQSPATMLRFLRLMSVNANSTSANSGTVRRSATSFRVKPIDPAPMKAMRRGMLGVLVGGMAGGAHRFKAFVSQDKLLVAQALADRGLAGGHVPGELQDFAADLVQGAAALEDAAPVDVHVLAHPPECLGICADLD